MVVEFGGRLEIGIYPLTDFRCAIFWENFVSEKRWGADKGEGRRVPGNSSSLDGVPFHSSRARSREV
jgi:hypothetical protein